MIRKTKQKVTKKIIYEGKEYFGWEDLKQQTGVSKCLYNKYYKHGVNPTFRIGKDGPLEYEDIKNIIIQYCLHINENYPATKNEALNICNNACKCGILSTKQIEMFLYNFK